VEVYTTALFPRKIKTAHNRAPERKRNRPNLFLFRLIISKLKESDFHLFIQVRCTEETYLNRFYDGQLFQAIVTPIEPLRILAKNSAEYGQTAGLV